VKTHNGRIGFFVIAGLFLFGLGTFLIGDRRQAFARHREYYSEFKNLAGLAKGAKVQVGGMDGGEVVSVGVPSSPNSRFRVKWRIDAKLAGLVRANSVATIGTEGVVGDTYLSVIAGTANAPEAASNATIPSKEPIEISEILARGTTLLDHVDRTLTETGGKLNGALDGVTATVSNVNDIVVGLKRGRGTAGMLLSDDAFAKQIKSGVTTTLSNANDVVADLKAGRGAAGMLLRDEALAGQIREAVTNGQKAASDLAHASGQADALASELNSRKLAQKAGEVIDNLNETTRQARALVAEISKPDEHGMTAGANIRQSLTHTNAATANLVDDSEALKHNFLLKGFFKRRGYFNMAELSPEKYRTERALISPANRRVWLSGAELFQKSPDGEEQFSPNGRALLDSALTENGDRWPAGPLIIEGYGNGGSPTEQLRISHARALIVRQYLEAHFHIDAKDLGAVALKNQPPKGIGYATWDGVCIVVLQKS
jgi:phospholipid/cholesterol/gamma-HCH transport system substrate-binding protein